MRLEEKGTSQRDTHPPTTTHILRGLLHHGLGETKTMEDTPRLRLESRGVHFLELLVQAIDDSFIYVGIGGEIFYPLLEFRDLLLGGRNDEVDRIDI